MKAIRKSDGKEVEVRPFGVYNPHSGLKHIYGFVDADKKEYLPSEIELVGPEKLVKIDPKVTEYINQALKGE